MKISYSRTVLSSYVNYAAAMELLYGIVVFNIRAGSGSALPHHIEAKDICFHKSTYARIHESDNNEACL